MSILVNLHIGVYFSKLNYLCLFLERETESKPYVLLVVLHVLLSADFFNLHVSFSKKSIRKRRPNLVSIDSVCKGYQQIQVSRQHQQRKSSSQTNMVIKIWFNSLPTGYFFMLFCSLLIFFQNQLFRKNLSGIPSEWQTVRIQISPGILLGLIWNQTVCKVYQQTTLVGKLVKSIK